MASLNMICFWKNFEKNVHKHQFSSASQLAQLLSDLSQESIYAHTKQNHLTFSKKILSQKLDDSSPVFAALFFLEYKNKVCAFLSAEVSYETVEIDFISVLKDDQRLGFGQKLFHALQEKLSQEDLGFNYRFMLEVGEHNLSAISFYEHLGFKILKRRLKYYHSTEDALIMTKD